MNRKQNKKVGDTVKNKNLRCFFRGCTTDSKYASDCFVSFPSPCFRVKNKLVNPTKRHLDVCPGCRKCHRWVTQCGLVSITDVNKYTSICGLHFVDRQPSDLFPDPLPAEEVLKMRTMVQCWAPDCKHYNVRETCRFFSFPKDSKTRNRWIKLTRRTIPPGPGAFLCSCHFVDGNKNNGPTLFSHNIGKQFNFSSPEKRTRKRKVLDMEETSENSTYETELTDAQPSTSKETIPPGPMSAEIVAENYFLKQDLKRSRRNSAKKINLLKASVKMTVQEKHEAIVNCSDSTSISGTKHDVNRGTSTLPKKKLRNASKIDFNPDDFDPLDLNNLLLSTTNIFQGMCDELKNSMILKNPGNLNLDNEHITLTTSAGDKEQSVQIVIVNNKPEITNPSFESNKDNLEEMLDDIEKTIASAEKDYQENLSTRTISTQTDNRSLEAENKKLKLEIATLKSRIISLQNQLQQQDVPQLLFVCNDD